MYLLHYNILEKARMLLFHFPRMSSVKIGGVMKMFGVKLVYFFTPLVRLLLGFLRKAHGKETLQHAALGVLTQCLCCSDTEHVDFTTENHVQHVHNSRG